jgi:nitrogen regulatory protein PII
MKCLTLFVHASLEHELVDRLRADERVTGFTLTPCQGHSTSTEDDPFLATRDRVIGHVPRLRIEIVLEDEIVTSVLEGLRECGPPGASLGAWHVTEVLDFGRL